MMKQKSYVLEVVDGISVVRFLREATLSDVFAALDEIVARGVTRRQLWIYSFGGNADSSELKMLAQKGIDLWPVPSKSAVVAPDDLTFGLARMYVVLFRKHEGLEMRVFREEPEAVLWLKSE